MSPSLFSYGTLEIPEVMRAVSGRTFPATPAILPDYARFLLQGETYPGISRERCGEVTGVLYEEVDRASLALIDLFEGEPFRREIVEVVTAKHLRVAAFTYVVPVERKSLLSSLPWDREFFIARHLDDFLSHCREFHRKQARRLSIPPESQRAGERPGDEEAR